MENVTIRALIQESHIIENKLTAAEGIVSEDLDALLQLHEGLVSAKADRVGFVLDRLIQSIEYYREKERELKELRQRTELAKDPLENRLKELVHHNEG